MPRCCCETPKQSLASGLCPRLYFSRRSSDGIVISQAAARVVDPPSLRSSSAQRTVRTPNPVALHTYIAPVVLFFRTIDVVGVRLLPSPGRPREQRPCPRARGGTDCRPAASSPCGKHMGRDEPSRRPIIRGPVGGDANVAAVSKLVGDPVAVGTCRDTLTTSASLVSCG